ncbi:mammaglobin-A-like [Dasypus novemcinctus]|uniref:mammaglobin-A-like n=1 Tax=Dasypus novemcinctus TaxID=9361 RepID=UPI000328D670
MKLLMVLLLVALPLYCYAGSGCKLLEDVTEKSIDPAVSKAEFKEFLKMFITESDYEAVDEFKQCFLNQSNESLANDLEMVNIIYNSTWCAPF